MTQEEKAFKVEPKFKVGDWVVDRNGTVQQILSYKDCIYKHTNGYSSKMFEDEWRMWNIAKDAKDGDVLATDDGNIFVFDGTVEEDKYPFAYYGLTRRRFESYDRRLPFTHNNVHPATKEQLDQLEKAMADAGYTFDFEKKELRKIEQKFAEWDEEDENRFNNLIFLVECSDENEPTKKGFIDFINRLKSTSHQGYGSRVMNREDLLNKLEEIQTEYKRRMHDAQAKEDYIFASGLCGAISRVIKIVKED